MQLQRGGYCNSTIVSFRARTYTTQDDSQGSEYDDVDVDDLLAQLTPEEINMLAKEVDPDVSFKTVFVI